jgi:hypothetical protein
MAHGMNQPDELALVRRELKMASGERPTEEGQRPLPLIEDGAEPDARGVAVHDEWPIEIRHLEHGPCRERPLKRLEGLCGLRVPGEGVVAQEAGQRRGDEAKVPDVLPVVAREPQEAAKSPW